MAAVTDAHRAPVPCLRALIGAGRRRRGTEVRATRCLAQPVLLLMSNIVPEDISVADWCGPDLRGALRYSILEAAPRSHATVWLKTRKAKGVAVACNVHDSGNHPRTFARRCVPTARRSPPRIALASILLSALALVATPAHAKIVDVIEFYNKSKDHYFITSIKTEIDKLDSGRDQGLDAHRQAVPRARNARERHQSRVPLLHSRRPGRFAFLLRVRRGVREGARQVSVVREESDAVMHIGLPDITSPGKRRQRPRARLPLVERARSTPTTATSPSITLRDQMVALGWIAEGYGARRRRHVRATKSAAEPDRRHCRAAAAVQGHGLARRGAERAARHVRVGAERYMYVVPREGRDRQGSDALRRQPRHLLVVGGNGRTAYTTGAR